MDAAVAAALPAQRTPPLLTITVLGQPKGRTQPAPSILKANPAKGRFHDRAMVFEDADTRSYQGVMRHCAARAMREAGLEIPLDCPLRVRVTAVLAIPMSYSQKAQRAAREGHLRPTTKPDVENLAKQMDAFNKIVWRDDSLIVEEVIRKFYGTNPLLMVEVWRWAPPALL